MKTAKLFQNGQSQAVRLPKEFRFEDDHVFVKKSGNVVVLIPTKNSWDILIHSLNKFSDDFMIERKQPKMQKREETSDEVHAGYEYLHLPHQKTTAKGTQAFQSSYHRRHRDILCYSCGTSLRCIKEPVRREKPASPR